MKIDVNVTTPWASREDRKKIVIKPSGYGANHKGFALLDLSACERHGIDLADLSHGCLPLFYAEYASAIKERLEQTDLHQHVHSEAREARKRREREAEAINMRKIKDLEADLYETIPFKRSQAHVHGDDQAWIDKWEKEVEAELGERRANIPYLADDTKANEEARYGDCEDADAEARAIEERAWRESDDAEEKS